MADSLSGVTMAAYDAVLRHDGWNVALDALTGSINAKGAVVVLQEHGLPFEGFTSLSKAYRDNVDGRFDQYQRELSHLEAPAWEKLASYRPGQVMRDTELGFSAKDLDAQPHYVFGIEHMDIRRRIAFRSNENRAWFDAIAIAYDASMSEVPQNIDSILGPLIPHLGKALELTRAFSLLRQRYQAVLSALDRFGVGIAIALPTGEVIVSNAEAQRMFDEQDAVRLRPDGMIDCAAADTNSELQEAIRRAALTAGGEDNALAAPMLLERRSGQEPVLIDIASLRDSEAEVERHLAGALIFLIDMENPPQLDVHRFGGLYSLTDAEIDVCTLMVEGNSAALISEKRGTSIHTAQNQVKSILAKCDCRNRTQLLRLVTKTLPPIL